MRRFLIACGIAVGLTIPAVHVSGQAAKSKPANATAECSDGTWSTAKSQQGACSNHGGVKTWLGPESGKAASTKVEPKTKAAPKSDTASTPTPKAASKSASASPRPSNATGECKDGSYTTAASKSGACSGHGGVATWYAESGAPNTKATTAPKSTTTAPPPPPPSAASTAPKSSSKTPSSTAAPSGSTSKSKAATIARPADAPSDATGQCNDGTYTKAKNHQGACSGHKGVKGWF